MPTHSSARKKSADPQQLRRGQVSGTRTALSIAAILVGGLMAYANSFAGVLVFDDEPAIVQNTYLRTLWPLTKAMQAPEGTTVSGRPVVSLTLAINYALAPSHARDLLALPAVGAFPNDRDRLHSSLWGYHAFNLAIHLAAALTLFGILRQTLSGEWRPSIVQERADSVPARPAVARGRRRWKGDEKQPRVDTESDALLSPEQRRARNTTAEPAAHGLALAIALVWTVHPLQTAAVTYVVQRAESLMGLFLLLTLYCAIRAWRGSRWWAAAAVAACALGMGSKETMVVAPLVVLLWDWTFASPTRALRSRGPLYAGLAATWMILAVLVAGGHRPNAAGFGFTAWPWWTYLLTQAGVIVHYLRLSIAPWPLVLDYAWPAARLVQVVPQLVIVAGLTAWTARGISRRSPAAFLTGSFLLVLAPSSSILPIVTEVAAEHRMYLPLAAVLSLLALGGHTMLRRWAPAAAPRAGLVLTIAVVGLLTSLTHARNADYHDHERLWLDTIENRPLNARARNNYATLLVAQGRYREAEAQLRNAIDTDPSSAESQQTLGVTLCAQGRCSEGIGYFEAAARLAPASADVQRNLGEAYASVGRMAEAAAQYQRALEARPDDVMLLNRAGWILATDDGPARNGARAVVLAERAAQLTGRQDVESLDTLAASYAELGRFDEAVEAVAGALRIAPARAPAMIPELEQRLAGYRARRPFRQSSPLEIR